MRSLRFLCLITLTLAWCNTSHAASLCQFVNHDAPHIVLSDHVPNDEINHSFEQEDEQEFDDPYHEGMDAIDEGKWQRAVDLFEKVARSKHPRADGALYWKAYAFGKMNRPADALESIARLRKEFPKSRWLEDARALEVDVRRPAADKQNADETDDDEIKVLAMSSLMGSNEKRAVDMLEKILKSTSSVKVKEQALFVLSQSDSPQALDVVRRYAKGEGNPDLQLKAIECLGLDEGKENLAILEQAYGSSADIEVKQAILNAFAIAGARKQLLDVVSKEKNEELLETAIQQLGVTGGGAEIWQLYSTQTSVKVKKAILNGLMVAEDGEHLLAVARTENNKELKATAIQGLGVMEKSDALVALYKAETTKEMKEVILTSLGIAHALPPILEAAKSESDLELKKTAITQIGIIDGEEARQALRSMYQQDTNREVREAILESMFIAEDATGLIAIAKSEKDRELRLAAVRQLSLMDAKEAKDYMVKLLGVKEDSQ